MFNNMRRLQGLILFDLFSFYSYSDLNSQQMKITYMVYWGYGSTQAHVVDHKTSYSGGTTFDNVRYTVYNDTIYPLVLHQRIYWYCLWGQIMKQWQRWGCSGSFWWLMFRGIAKGLPLRELKPLNLLRPLQRLKHYMENNN